MEQPPGTYPLLERIELPADLRTLPEPQLEQVCDELRRFINERIQRNPMILPVIVDLG